MENTSLLWKAQIIGPYKPKVRRLRTQATKASVDKDSGKKTMALEQQETVTCLSWDLLCSRSDGCVRVRKALDEVPHLYYLLPSANLRGQYCDKGLVLLMMCRFGNTNIHTNGLCQHDNARDHLGSDGEMAAREVWDIMLHPWINHRVQTLTP